MVKRIILLGLIFVNLNILPVYEFKSWNDPVLVNLLRYDRYKLSDCEPVDMSRGVFYFNQTNNAVQKTLIFLKCLSKKHLDQTKALFFAVLFDDLNLAQDLIDFGFDVNAKHLDKTPLDLAKSPKMVELLVAAGSKASNNLN